MSSHYKNANTRQSMAANGIPEVISDHVNFHFLTCHIQATFLCARPMCSGRWRSKWSRKNLPHTKFRTKNCNDAIIAAIDGHNNTKLFFVDGPGGTGKTYLYNLLAKQIAIRRKKVGIAHPCIAHTCIYRRCVWLGQVSLLHFFHEAKRVTQHSSYHWI